MTGDTFAKVHELICDAAIVHNGAGHDKKGDGQHGKGPCGVHDLLKNCPGLNGGVNKQEVEECGTKQRIDNRHSEKIENEDEENGDQICKCQHQQAPPSSSASLDSSCGLTLMRCKRSRRKK